MKLSARETSGYFRKPDPGRAGLLIFGADAARVAMHRAQTVAALVGPQAEAEMRLSRLPAAELRGAPALLLDAVKAMGFFPGPRAVVVDGAADGAAPAFAAALGDWQPGDAAIIVTAGALKPTSKLRKLFEAAPNAFAAAIYDSPPDRAEIGRMLQAGGLQDVPGEAMNALGDLARSLGPGDFRQTVEKIALYKHGDASPLSVEEVALSAPATMDTAVDEVLNIVAEARSAEIGPILRRLEAQGTNAVSLCIGAMRHFRTLYAAACDPGGAMAGIGRARPPIYGPRRERMGRQAQNWGAERLEQAIGLLLDTDLALRSAGQSAPAMALVERMLIRLSMLARRH